MTRVISHKSRAVRKSVGNDTMALLSYYFYETACSFSELWHAGCGTWSECSAGEHFPEEGKQLVFIWLPWLWYCLLPILWFALQTIPGNKDSGTWYSGLRASIHRKSNWKVPRELSISIHCSSPGRVTRLRGHPKGSFSPWDVSVWDALG